MKNQTTVLPDGSAFFTAEVMSKAEAMALPIDKRPICYRVSSELYHDTFEAIGEASRCWKEEGGKGEFDSDHATQVVMKLLFKFAHEKERAVAACLESGSQSDNDQEP